MTLSASLVVSLAVFFVAGVIVGWLFARFGRARDIALSSAQLKNDIYEANQRVAGAQRDAFLSLANERLDRALAPVAQKLGEFDALIGELERARAGAYEGLKEQIAGLSARNEQLNQAAAELSKQSAALVSALRNPTARGKWGEVQLRRVVELAGMEPYCDFAEQQTFALGDERGRPDVVVRLPGRGMIFVDAKVPLDAYLDASEATDDAARRDRLRAHAAAFKQHADALAKRDYARADGSADFVVMFVPGEAFLSAACTENPELVEYGAARGVYIASPLTLMALLRAYAAGWRQREQEENAKKIAAAARELYERLRVFAGHVGGVGTALQRAVTSYNSAVGSLETRLLPQGRRIKEMAALPNDDLPELPAVELAAREVTALDAEQGTLFSESDAT